MKERARTPTAVTVHRSLPASPTEVFEAWTTPEIMAKWLSPEGLSVHSVDVDLRVGGRYRFVMSDGRLDVEHFGEYREISPPERLVFTWHSDFTKREPTLVIVTLRAEGDRTEMQLTHELLPGDLAAKMHEDGWNRIMRRLEAFLTGKKAD